MARNLTVNGEMVTVDAADDTPLLWVLRDELNLTGTKFGCGIAACGACTVHIGGEAVRSCQVALADIWGEVVTIEGLAMAPPADQQPDTDTDGPLRTGTLHPVQDAWIRNQVAQCGYCQSGQIMQAVALLAEVPDPSDAEIDEWMAGNLCRCGTYSRIRDAIHEAAETLRRA
ncbi:(2Fe-2S)-binding protein [Pararhodobacter sp. SW119]|uniref:(2Fe-2S)-binding protein n=1 Tax=Pararhodobacter sp. SW119 TaxID=2780075 RepID=UPI001AE04759|nr:(2Fe-2S)-binding protein [Pararhodobacter sp. SW119]